MKKLAAFIMTGILAGMSFVGCDLGTDPTDSPTCDFNSIAVSSELTAGGGSVPVTGELEGSDEITEVSIRFLNDGGSAASGFTRNYDAVQKKKLNLESDLNLKITAGESVTAGSYKLEITATVEGEEFTTTVSFTVDGPSGTTLSEKTDGIISNLYGPDEGAFNLVDGSRVSSSTADGTKDLLDLSLVGEGFAGELGSGNDSKFATASESDYNNATDVSVAALAANASADKIDVSSVGTVFVVKLGNSRGSAIVKITSYDASAGGSTGNNKGEVEFSYKITD